MVCQIAGPFIASANAITVLNRCLDLLRTDHAEGDEPETGSTAILPNQRRSNR